MTTEERARETAPLLLKILADYQSSPEHEHKNQIEHAALSLQIMLDAAIEEEREACAKIVRTAIEACEGVSPARNEDWIFRDGAVRIGALIEKEIRARSALIT